jgi:YHS domain-containing protein
MSWKLSTLAIALLGFLTSSLMAGGQNAPWQRADRQSDSPVIGSGDTSPVAAAKPTDKELIEKQKTCPVTDQPLGSMGKPVKVVTKGRTVFLCCAGCKKKFLANRDKYLKKLDEQNEKK